jgi:GDP-L-fucose synthase
MKKILLLGGAGMVGNNIINHELYRKWEFVHPNSKELDLTNFNATTEYINKLNPYFIINAAGHVGGIYDNMSHQVDFLITNMDIGRNVVIAAYQSGVKKLLNLGASCMYPKNCINPLKEEMILQGGLEPTNEGYALAKIMTARLCQYINNESSMFQYKTMIPCNVYGRYDNFDNKKSHIVSAIIKKLHYAIVNNESHVEIWGNGKAKRELMYAEDLADAIYYAIDNFNKMPELLNIGTGYDNSVNEIYSIAAKVMNFQGIFTHNLNMPVGMLQKLVSIERQTAWGWKPKTKLYDGIRKTYDYYLQEYKA